MLTGRRRPSSLAPPDDESASCIPPPCCCYLFTETPGGSRTARCAGLWGAKLTTMRPCTTATCSGLVPSTSGRQQQTPWVVPCRLMRPHQQQQFLPQSLQPVQRRRVQAAVSNVAAPQTPQTYGKGKVVKVRPAAATACCQPVGLPCDASKACGRSLHLRSRLCELPAYQPPHPSHRGSNRARSALVANPSRVPPPARRWPPTACATSPSSRTSTTASPRWRTSC